MAIVPKPVGTLGNPTDKTSQTAVKPGNPANKTSVAATKPGSPTAKTSQTAVKPGNPTAKTSQTAVKPGSPTAKTSQTAVKPGNPTAKTSVTASVVPRTMTPALNLDFEDGLYSLGGVPKMASEAFTYSRSSDASYIGIHLDNKLSARQAIFVNYAGSTTNLVPYSEQMNSGSWSIAGITVSPDAAASPYGDVAADKLTDTIDGSPSVHYVSSDVVTVSVGADVNLSIFAKSDSAHGILLYETTSDTGAYFNLNSGSIEGPFGTIVESRIEHITNGWYRCSMTITASSTSARLRCYITSAPNTEVYQGAGKKSVLLWGAQITQSTKIRPYVKTLNAAVAAGSTPSLRREWVSRYNKYGVLIEKAVTNSILFSEQLNNAAWVKAGGTTIVTNDYPAPDLSLSMDRVVGPSAGSEMSQSVVLSSSTNHTLSVYIKNRNSGQIRLEAYSSVAATTQAFAEIAIPATGPFVVLSGGASFISCKFEHVVNDIYRISLSFVSNPSGGAHSFYLFPDRSGGGGGLWAWGFQVEQSRFATSYIHTTSAVTSRSVDSVSGAVSLFGVGTIKIEADVSGFETTFNQYIASVGINASDATSILAEAGTGDIRQYMELGGFVQVNMIKSGESFTDKRNAAITFENNSVIAYSNGIQYASDVLAIVPNASKFQVGGDINGGATMSGHVYSVKIFDMTATAQELASI